MRHTGHDHIMFGEENSKTVRRTITVSAGRGFSPDGRGRESGTAGAGQRRQRLAQFAGYDAGKGHRWRYANSLGRGRTPRLVPDRMAGTPCCSWRGDAEL